MRRLTAGLSTLALLATAPAQADAQKPAPAPAFQYWPGARYDPAIPTLRSVVGHDLGARVTRPDDLVRYFEALAKAAPDRMRLFTYGRTWQGRPLVYAVIGAPAQIARLDAFKADIARAADPGEGRFSPTTPPATVWLGNSVHGNEISPADAAAMTAYHLLAARNDPTVDKIFAGAVAFIDPVQNPDGRARFVHNFESARGLEPSGSRVAAERNEPWPSGRTNHYLFDMNRDWFAMTQPETQGRVKALRDWRPLIFVDAHEMGSDETFFFAPDAPPLNPHLTKAHEEAQALVGRNNAKWFDRFGFRYFTREVYDGFFPGYGASWPSYYGGVAMTYEQASPRGLKARRSDGSTYSYRDAVKRHFVAAISTLDAAAANRETLWREFRAYQTSAVEEGRREAVKSYILPAGEDDAGAMRLAGLLERQGASVRTATREFSACGKKYAAGTHVVPLAQPAKRLIRTLMDPQVEIEKDFLAEQERRRAKKLPDEIYDVTAWSLPLMFGVKADACGEAAGMGPAFKDHSGAMRQAGALLGPERALAYLVAWGERPAAQFLSKALRAGVRVRSSDKPFTHEGRRWPAGTLIIDGRVEGRRETLRKFAVETGARVHAVGSSWTSEGASFGSGGVVTLPAPAIAIAWDEPASPNAAGAARFVIERQLGYPATAVRVEDLGDRALDQFDTLVLPAGGDYAALLGERGVGRLRAWVEAGGVLVTLGTATRFLADPDTELSSLRRETAAREGDAKKDDDEKKSKVDGVLLADEAAAKKAIVPLKDDPDASAGVLVAADVDADHWLAAGVRARLSALYTGGDIYAPLKLDEGVVVARFSGADRLVASGHLWAETKKQLAYKPFVTVEEKGDGLVIAFAADPTTRAYLDGLNIILANALFRAPAHAGKLR